MNMTDCLKMTSIPLGSQNSQNSNYEELPANLPNSSDDDTPANKAKKRMTRFSDSSSDDENVQKELVNSIINDTSDNDNEEPIPKSIPIKSRIRKYSHSSSDDENPVNNLPLKSKYSMRGKKNSFRDKFKKMVANEEKSRRKMKDNTAELENEDDSESETSCLSIKQKIKEKSSHISLSVCDPDDSEDETNDSVSNITKIKKVSKVKYTEPKPMRMSAKEAMENMKKIKSESNRRLREKEVSLPYHRPKALSLKDIMSRRKPAVSSDGKSLPIKMNEEQLRNYAKLLEQRQKEMMELCKSESEEEDNDNQVIESEKVSSNIENQLKPSEIMETANIEQETEKPNDMSETNDISFDQVANENTESPKNISLDKMETEKNENTELVLVERNNEDDLKIKSDEILAEDISMEDHKDISKNNPEESQMICLHYDSEKPESAAKDSLEDINESKDKNESQMEVEFSDNELNYDDIDALIENAEIVKDIEHQTVNVTKKLLDIQTKPKLTGGPGMVISLDDDDTSVKPSGVELLKERFTFFANLKKEEDMEKDREKKYKPGTQHIKLKQQLEDEIAQQRSIEWEKRLEEEKLLKLEQKEILGDNSVDDIDEIEKKLDDEKSDNGDGAESGTDDDDLVEDDVDMSDKPQKRSGMIDDEAEESDEENGELNEENPQAEESNVNEVGGGDSDEDNIDDEDSDSSESSESEDDIDDLKPKKGRILKAFEDSDEENEEVNNKETKEHTKEKISNEEKQSQDEELQLAQGNTSISEDLFSTQESSSTIVNLTKNSKEMTSGELGTFSILTTSNIEERNIESNSPDKINVICETQPENVNFDDIAGMCSGSFSQNIVPTQLEKSQLSPSQEIGEDIAALCTGKFYDNQFVSQPNDLETKTATFEDKDILTPSLTPNLPEDSENTEQTSATSSKVPDNLETKTKENDILKSILEELDDPEYDKPKQNKFFPSNKEDVKKKFVIDSDDETNDGQEESRIKKKRKKRKLEDRALQISDDEDEDIEYDDESEEVDDNLEEKLYEYDSEENEVEVRQEKPQKKKRVGDFFENEAELTSEDEWAGSGDEDEAGLDRMEREEGDDEQFHQGQLQRELGQIHMREVLDQDKREVRLIQELLFEDADLGDGHRQRKFRWKNIDGEDETGMAVDEFGDTQDDEFESEEQWRKQRHEREMFLRKLKEEGKEEDTNTSINRTTIIKANLISRTMSNLIAETEKNSAEKENTIVPEKKLATNKDIPSPKKSFAIFKQNYHGSLLTRGRGALARLAALATPLAGDDDAPNRLASATGNFVFAAAEESKPKKRKAEVVNTPQLIKRMKTAELKKTSLFDRLKD